jgi:hypothetical protein
MENAAEQAGVGPAAASYTIEWSTCDNGGGTTPASIEERVTAPRGQVPAALLTMGPAFLSARVRATHPDRAAWSEPVTFCFRRADAGWSLVGVERGV